MPCQSLCHSVMWIEGNHGHGVGQCQILKQDVPSKPHQEASKFRSPTNHIDTARLDSPRWPPFVSCISFAAVQIHASFIMIIYSKCVFYRTCYHGDKILPDFRLSDGGCCPVSSACRKRSLPAPSCSDSTFSGSISLGSQSFFRG